MIKIEANYIYVANIDLADDETIEYYCQNLPEFFGEFIDKKVIKPASSLVKKLINTALKPIKFALKINLGYNRRRFMSTTMRRNMLWLGTMKQFFIISIR